MSPTCQLSFSYWDTSTKSSPESYISYFLKFLIPRLIYSILYLCIRMCLHVCILTWRLEIGNGCLPQWLTTLFSKTGFTDWAWPAGHGSQGSSITNHLPRAETADMSAALSVLFLRECWQLNPGLHAYRAGALPSEPSPWLRASNSSSCSLSLRQLEKILVSQKWVGRLVFKRMYWASMLGKNIWGVGEHWPPFWPWHLNPCIPPPVPSPYPVSRENMADLSLQCICSYLAVCRNFTWTPWIVP